MRGHECECAKGGEGSFLAKRRCQLKITLPISSTGFASCYESVHRTGSLTDNGEVGLIEEDRMVCLNT